MSVRKQMMAVLLAVSLSFTPLSTACPRTVGATENTESTDTTTTTDSSDTKETTDAATTTTTTTTSTNTFTGIKKKVLYVNGKKYVGKLISVSKKKSVNKKAYKYFTYKVDGKTYAFDKNSKMITNQIVGTGSKAYYYGKDGVRVTSKQIKQAVKFVQKHGGSNNTRSSKLSKCFYYLSNRSHYSHDPDHTAKLCTKKGLPKAANKMLKNVNGGKGNCFGWASAFAYIGRVLGYDTKVVKTTTRLVSGGYGPHGLTRIKYNGHWLLCDPNMNYKRNTYLKTYKSYPFSLGSSKKYYTLYTSGSVAKWK